MQSVRIMRVDTPKGTLVTGVPPALMRKLRRAIMAELGRAGGRKSTPAKRKAALAREARKRRERGRR